MLSVEVAAVCKEEKEAGYIYKRRSLIMSLLHGYHKLIILVLV